MSQKHREKKPLPPSPAAGATELPLPDSPAPLIHAAGGKTSVRSSLIEHLTGFNDAALRRLGAREIIPSPVRARWPLELTIKKLFAHLRSETTAAHDESRFEKLSFPSMEACEARTGIPKTFQQTAKESGCPAFRDSRVYLAELLRWTFLQGTEAERTNWTKFGDKYRALNEKVKYDQALGQLVSRDEMKAFIQSLMAICFSALKRWRQECPRELEKRDKEFIKTSLDTKFQTTIAQAQSKLDTLELKIPALENK